MSHEAMTCELGSKLEKVTNSQCMFCSKNKNTLSKNDNVMVVKNDNTLTKS